MSGYWPNPPPQFRDPGACPAGMAPMGGMQSMGVQHGIMPVQVITAGQFQNPPVQGNKWYIRKGGSNANGGGSPGTAPDRTGADGHGTNGNTTFTSATAAFTQADVGKGIGLVGNTQTRAYKILVVTNGTTVTLDRAYSDTTGTTTTWNIGGAWLDFTAFLTNVGNPNNLIVGGDTIYVGAGTYRQTLTAANIYIGGVVTIFGDVYGQYTGDAGMVQITAYTTNDKTAPSASILLNTNGKNNLTFRNIYFVLGTADGGITDNGVPSQNISFINCAFNCINTDRGIRIQTTGGVTANWLFDSCKLFNKARGVAGGVIDITIARNPNGFDYDTGIVFKNTILIGGGTNNIRIASSGAGAGSGGGVIIRQCHLFGTPTQAISTSDSNLSKSIPVQVVGCWMATDVGVNAFNSGQIFEDYNIFSCNTARSNVNTGPHSATREFAPLISFGQETIWGGTVRPFGEPSAGSPLLNLGAPDVSAGLKDVRGGPRPSLASRFAAGAFQRGGAFTPTTSVTQSGANAVTILGDGHHDFDVAVDAGPVTLSVYMRYDSNYAGPLPRLMIVNAMQVGVGDYELPISGASLNTFVKYQITINPTAAGVVTFRLISGDTSGIGNVYADTFAAA